MTADDLLKATELSNKADQKINSIIKALKHQDTVEQDVNSMRRNLPKHLAARNLSTTEVIAWFHQNDKQLN